MFCFILIIYFTNAYASVDLLIADGAQAVCSGSNITLQCTLAGDFLTWITPHGDINLVRGVHNMSTSGSYYWQLRELDEDTIQSIITFVVDTEIEIGCTDRFISSSIIVAVEGTPSAPSKPQTSVDRIKRINNTFSTVSITWDIPDTNNAHISSYFVIVFPYIIIPANGIISMSNPLFMERELTLLLQNEQQYNIQVRANSCEDMVEGETSAALTITVKVPPSVRTCTAVPVYDYTSNHLIQIDIKWEPITEDTVDSENIITDGITGTIQSYVINLAPTSESAPEINITLDATNNSACTSMCSYTFSDTTEMSALYYSIFVTVKNILPGGFSDQVMCSHLTLSPLNDFLSMDFRQVGSGYVNVLCRLLSRFEGTAICNVTYSIFPNGCTYTETSESDIDMDGIVTISLTTVFEHNTTLLVETLAVGENQNVAVRGIFKTGTLESTHENVTECFNTRNDNETNMNSTQDTHIHVCSYIPWILAAGIFIISLPVGIVLGVCARSFCKSKQKNKKEESNPFHDYIKPQDKQNIIQMESNKCYLTRATPQLPQPRVT